MTFTPAEAACCRQLVEMALSEDLGSVGDVTSASLIPADLVGAAAFVARSAGVLAGLNAVQLTLAAVDPQLVLETRLADGAALSPGVVVALVTGPMRGLLTAERTALNFLQRLSGVASLTRRYVEAIAGLAAGIYDTRKTTPGWRLLEKYAVRCGGGHNHRIGLYDGILIKDNHLAALREPDAIAEAVRRGRASGLPVEIEVDTLEQLDEALRCQPEIVLLDNMSPAQMRDAVRRRDVVAPHVQLEASGGVSLQTVRAIAEAGVERISVGALTHSAPALDLALDYADLSGKAAHA